MALRCASVLRLVLAATAFAAAEPAEAKLAELMVTDSGHVKSIDLDKAAVSVKVDQTAALVSYDLTFTSGQWSAQEGTFYFAVPRNAYVHEFGMWVDSRYESSAVVEAQAGRAAFDTLVRRGIDPALLEWTAGNTFKMRVYPMISGKSTRIKLTIGMPLALYNDRLEANLPLDFGKVAKFKLDVHGTAHSNEVPTVVDFKGLALEETNRKDDVLKFAGKVAKKNFLPPDSFALRIKAPSHETLILRREDGDSERYFEASAFPDLPTATRPAPASAVVYWDFSLSESDSMATRLQALHTYVDARKPPTIDIYGFNQTVFPLAKGLKADDWGKIAATIRRHAYDGATRLDLLADELQHAAAQDANKVRDLLIFTNGVDSYELFDFKHTKDLSGKFLQAFIIAPSIGANDVLLQAFARELSAVVLDQDRHNQSTAFTVVPWRVKGIKYSANLKAIELPTERALFPKDGLVFRGQVKKDGNATFVVELARGSETKSVKFKSNTEIEPGQTGTVAKLWAASRMTRLLANKRENATEITAISLKHQIMSPFTNMIVLEYCEDYAEFKLVAPKSCAKRPAEVVDDVAEARFDDGDEAGDGAASDKDNDKIDFEEADIGGERTSPLSGLAATAPSGSDDDAPSTAGDTAAGNAESIDEVMADRGAPSNVDASERLFDEDTPIDEELFRAPEPDSVVRAFGFEGSLNAASDKGVDTLYVEYIRQRQSFEKVPYFYVYSADLFAKLHRQDLADLVLSNVVEVRPGDARWLRVYAYKLVAWGKAPQTLPLYQAIAELRGEDPQSFRDYGLALEASGRPLEAMREFQRVYQGHWDERLEGMNLIIQHDLARAAEKTLRLPQLTANDRADAQRFVDIDGHKFDKIVITASWDTDNTDVDLRVVEPNGEHVYFNDKKPAQASGSLSFDATRGFGPEQYRNSQPYRGNYRVFLRYYSVNPAVIHDGTFVRVDFKIVTNGVEQLFTKTLFLSDQDEVQTLLNFDYQDSLARVAPPDFKSTMAKAEKQLQSKQFSNAKQALTDLGVNRDSHLEARRHFGLGRAELGLKHFDLAEQENQQALALDPNLVAAHYNNACAESLAHHAEKAIFHLNLLAEALQRRPELIGKFLRLMGTDDDLKFVRGAKGYKKAYERMDVAH